MATMTMTNLEEQTGGGAITSLVSASAAPETATIKPKPTPTFWVVVLSMLSVVAVAVIMWVAYHDWIKPKAIHFTAGYVPYIGIVAVTAALERFLEPLSHVLLPNGQAKQDAATSKSKAQVAAADPVQPAAAVQGMVSEAVTDQAKVDTLRTQRSIIFWAIASACGLAISGAFGLFLLQSVANGHVNTFLDLIVTGLTIGAGTKPLHDMITSIQAKAASSP